MSIVIKVENLSKQYRLGSVGTGSFAHDLNRTWHRLRGNEDPYLKIGEENDRTKKGSSEYVWALKDINFDVQHGEVLGIIGRNGAGKSTLLKILSRTTSPTKGSVKIKGRVASLLEVGTGFHPELSGRENIFLNGAILGMTRHEIKRKFDEIVNFAGVERYIDTPVKRYSSGMYVRLAFGVAAHLEPEILIVDEVLAVGDAEFQRKALGKMKDVSEKEGRTVLFVSHNMAAVQNLCTHGLVMKDGLIAFNGGASEAVEKYLSAQKIQNSIADMEASRIGNGLVKVIKIEICDLADNIIDQVFCGQDFKIKLHYKSEKPIDNLNLIPGIAITNQLEMPVSLHHSRLNKMIFKSVGNSGAFVFTVNKLALVPAVYNLTYTLLSDSVYLDGIPNVLQLQVIDGDYYGSGEVPPSSSAVCLLDGEWSQK